MSQDDFFSPDLSYQDEILQRVPKKQRTQAQRPLAQTRGIYRRGVELVAVASFCAVSYSTNASALSSNDENGVQFRVEQSSQTPDGRLVRPPPDIGSSIDRLYQKLAAEGDVMGEEEYRQTLVELRNLQATAAESMEKVLENQLSLPRRAGHDLIAKADRLLTKYEDSSSED
ncbi:hypothetical protein KAI87_12345 [Myxococcota bacterium]|nr:hypothetical protein [Myxococcota bacterium]